MRDFMNFSMNVQTQFENKAENALAFNTLMLDASNRVYSQYTEKETSEIIRNQFNRICGVADYKALSPMKRRQLWRRHGLEIAELVEDVLVDRTTSGWTAANAKFMEYVDTVNISEGQKNEWYVNDSSLLQVSKFAGNHHDIVRQALKPGKAFSIETSYYAIKCYSDFELFQIGRIDFAEMVDKMYKSIEQFRYAALYTAFMSMDQSIPSGLILDTASSSAVKDDIVAQIEAVKAATGKDVVLVGTRVAIQKLQNLVTYNMFSDAMKDEQNKNGILANWEGYACLGLDRVNKAGTLESVFSATDNKKVFILPVDPAFKPIKHVIEGDVMYTERFMDGSNMDMTPEVEIVFQEGVGVVIDQLFGEILFSA